MARSAAIALGMKSTKLREARRRDVSETGAGPEAGRSGRPASGKLDSLQGWVVVGAAFTALVTAFAVTYSFGTFFQAVSRDLRAGVGRTSLDRKSVV